MAPVILEIKGNVACISLNRPDKLNSFNREMALLLQSILDECRSDAIRAVYLTGNGKGFSAGQDLAEVTDPEGPGMAKILSEHYNPIIRRIRDLEKPVIAAVNGVAAGAGANIALCCDVVLAAGSASFIQAFSRIGLVPDSGGTFFLPRLVGFQKASALMMLGDKVSATEAEKMGMIYKVLPDEGFAEAGFAFALTLAGMPTRGLALTKKLLGMSLESNLSKQLSEEDRLQQQAAQSDDFQEGVAAFLEKRKPVFRGK
ncbi:MAG: 2-(1,2-epoxy-1,2-dihydrophenyl)acetyl-CoA isomerase [Chitinophagaceae bacterium]|nr:MAG: 2-(1,2-epoxy-1,2-dihydrophenyl)acetyl-CoA isomerase [Chitinophagaceae bacterium]